MSRGDFWSFDTAHDFVLRMVAALAEHDVRQAQFRRHRIAKADIIFGALFVVIGVLVTFLTAEMNLGVGIIVMYGAVIGGVLMLVRGLIRLSRERSTSSPH